MRDPAIRLRVRRFMHLNRAPKAPTMHQPECGFGGADRWAFASTDRLMRGSLVITVIVPSHVLRVTLNEYVDTYDD